MPIFFASNAICPIDIMPPWLRAVAQVNPLTYEVDALCALMLRGDPSVFGIGLGFAVLVVVLAALIAVAARLYGRTGASFVPIPAWVGRRPCRAPRAQWTRPVDGRSGRAQWTGWLAPLSSAQRQ